MFLRHLIGWPSDENQVKFYRDRPRGTPPAGELNTNIAILDLSEAISRKRCKIRGKLLVITNRKSHMSFRLVPNSVTLDDLERRNSPNRSIISPKLGSFRVNYVKVQRKCETKNQVFSDISLTAILAGDHA